jgi:hypothetical protein
LEEVNSKKVVDQLASCQLIDRPPADTTAIVPGKNDTRPDLSLLHPQTIKPDWGDFLPILLPQNCANLWPQIPRD